MPNDKPSSIVKSIYESSISNNDESRRASYSLSTAEFDEAEAKLRSEDITSNFSDISFSSLSAFNRYRTIFPGDEIDSLLKFVFIVKPDLNMLQAKNEDPFFQQLFRSNPNVIRNLTYCPSPELGIDAQTDFVSFLYDRTMSYGIPSYEVQTYELTQPYTGYKTVYAGNSNRSRTGLTFTMRFRENNNLEVTKFFEAWVRYIDLVSYGTLTPYREYAVSRFMSGVTEIDYATSIYLLMTKPDASTLVYWHKQTGAIPANVPHENWSYNDGSVTTDRDIDIQFYGGMPEAMTPRILADFNYNAGMYIENNDIVTGVDMNYSGISPARHARIGFEHERGGSTLVAGPYIAYDKNTREYKLKWRRFS